MDNMAQIQFNEEEVVRNQIRNFVYEGLKDVQENNLVDADEAFKKLEERYL